VNRSSEGINNVRVKLFPALHRIYENESSLSSLFSKRSL